MRAHPILALLALPLGACSGLREEKVQAKAPEPECRHVISPQGQPLRFCELGNRLVVDDKPLAAEPAQRRLVDDPQFLADMMMQLPQPKTSAKPQDKKSPKGKTAAVCTATEPGYITIAVSDIQRLMQLAAERAAAKQAETRTASLWGSIAETPEAN